jgi:hypothetical protein
MMVRARMSVPRPLVDTITDPPDEFDKPTSSHVCVVLIGAASRRSIVPSARAILKQCAAVGWPA